MQSRARIKAPIARPRPHRTPRIGAVQPADRVLSVAPCDNRGTDRNKETAMKDPVTPDDTAARHGPVAEIVTFRLRDGIDQAGFAAAARATAARLAREPGCRGRTLSRDDHGLWTDNVLWADAATAEAAAAAVVADPAFAPFLAAIEPASVQLRHAAVLPLGG
jgi:hypothetical protein